MMVDAVTREAELEEVTDALLLTGSDDFNALAAAELRAELGHGRVFRVAPDPTRPTWLAPPTSRASSARRLTLAELGRRLAGARIVEARQRRASDGRSCSSW